MGKMAHGGGFRKTRRLVGRDRPDDQDAADVPERRRPTASAHRLRVHQMTAEGRDMAEDVADMTDDVPELATEAPEMRADVHGADGGEGSDADDAAEGFPGGPRDPFHALSTEEARFLLTELLEVSAEEARAETTLTHGAYVRLGWVRDIYETRCQAWRWIVAARAYLLHLVDCTLFANKSATYVHVVHLDAFRDLAQSGGYAWGVAALVNICVLVAVHGASRVRAFQEISSFQGQLRWGPMVVTARSERVVRQFGYIQSIPPPPIRARLSHDQIDDRWMQFAEHLLPAGQLCLVPGQVSADYMEWFFRISHPFMIQIQADDQPRDALAADPEDYIQPPSPQVPVAFDPPPHVDDYDGYEAIAQKLERVLDLRMVTAGIELYDIMQDCLTIVRGGPSVDGTVRACQRRRMDH
ncbi:uncharacterized protein LOC114386079 [Glycine soja]|uniref:uncharacterized protein LOC114386079 n=1 Tax=Glycine soja TaxID=3848 RepID=UPI00103E3FE1|nr:uncharacterized protein LOC114386079 [Glycine soja]